MKVLALSEAFLPETQLGQAILDLTRALGLPARLLPAPVPPKDALSDPLLLERWMEAAGEYYGVEIEPVESKFPDAAEMMSRAAPCIVRTRDEGGTLGVIAVVASSPKYLEIVLPGQVRRRVRTADVVEALHAAVTHDLGPVVASWTAQLPLGEAGKKKAERALLNELAEQRPIVGPYLLRPRPGSSFWVQLRHSGDFSRLFAFASLTLLEVALGVLGWSSLFDAALNGRLEQSPLARWALLAVSTSLVEILRSFVVGRMKVSIAALLKRRLLAGTLQLPPNEIRAHGSGGLLAMISEAEVLETVGLSSLVGLLSASVSLVCAGLLLGRGVGGLAHVGLLAGWTAVVGASALVLQKRTQVWVDARLRMTNGLVERMVGHRTRLVQERPRERHKDEDVELELYVAESARMDGVARLVQSLPSRGWLLFGFVSLLPALWEGHLDIRPLLITMAGLFLAQSAFADVSASIIGMLNFSVAWSRVGALFHAAAVEEPYGLPAASVQEIGTAGGDLADGGAMLEARNVSFRYHDGGEPILRGLDLRVRGGERLLIEGKSGGGKSTFAGILSGLHTPDAGLVLHRGLDRSTLGTTSWRKRVATVPQFHENHVLTGSLAFNLLFGRRWPPTPADKEIAERVCRSLGLGPMLDRMPSGIEQVVGETGWQLSHGERARVYLARAILQDSDVVLADESFGALDPLTLRVAMDATRSHASTLIVIAHP